MSYDLRSESDLAAWRPPHEYSAAKNIWNGAIGAYEGTMWIETPRAVVAVDGAGTGPKATVYRTLVFARQALAEAVAEEPGIRFGPTVDRLMRTRFLPVRCSVRTERNPLKNNDSSLSVGMAFWAGPVFGSRLLRVSKLLAHCRLRRAS